ncbi:MAG: M50 family metallopeptidase [Bacteroides sp.]|nr:M50 family metallopeptidase [Eubacterium sp.]MCM1418461.1 M50 family metallopeptidase [Roseburia sp.]MCM1462057.1 M50 family metallopeptidase [Bacteroides sp.]
MDKNKIKTAKNTKNTVLTALNLIVTVGFMILVGREVGLFPDLAAPEAGAGASAGLLLLGFALFFLFYLLTILLHEAGHLVFGLLTGWRFTSFRVGNLTLIRRGGRFLLRRANLPGTAGQCLLEPPDGGYENCPSALYHLGGGLMNLIVGAVALAIAFALPPVAGSVLRVLALVNFAVAASNLIPTSRKGMTNDGYLAAELKNDPRSREASYLLLKAYAALIRVTYFNELPEELVRDILGYECRDLTSVSEANVYFYRSDFALYRGDYADAKAVSERLAYGEGVLEMFRKEAREKLLYFALMDGAPREEIERLYDPALKEHLKKKPDIPATRRLMYAIKLLYEKDEAAAEREYQALLKMPETAVCAAEAYAEINEASRLREKANTLSPEG